MKTQQTIAKLVEIEAAIAGLRQSLTEPEPAPDPGEGWRELSSGDLIEPGDEICMDDSRWEKAAIVGHRVKGARVRRRISVDPPHPPIPEGWRKIDPKKDWPKRADDKYYRDGMADWTCVDSRKGMTFKEAFTVDTHYIRRIEPAHQFKAGDWVRVTGAKGRDPWLDCMEKIIGEVHKIEGFTEEGGAEVDGWCIHPDDLEPITPQEAYLDRHKACGIKVGDTVRVVRAAECYEDGWGCSWLARMDAMAGKHGRVIDEHGNSGFFVKVDTESAWLPFFVLERVAPASLTIGDDVRILRADRSGIVGKVSDLRTDGAYKVDGTWYARHELQKVKPSVRPFRSLGEIVDQRRGLGVVDKSGRRWEVTGMLREAVAFVVGDTHMNLVAPAAMADFTWPDGDAFGVTEWEVAE